MKKIKILHGFIMFLIVIFIIHFSTIIYLEFFSNYAFQFKEASSSFLFNYVVEYAPIFISILTFIALLFLKKSLSIIIKKGFFNKSNSYFKKSGLFFFISGILSLIFDLAIAFKPENIVPFGNIGQDILLITVGFSLYIIDEIILDGKILKQENDLTI